MRSRRLSFACVLSAARWRLADERGFTIIEVLASAVIVAMAAVGTFAAFDSATATSGRNKARTTASQVAQTDQERVRSLTPLQLAALADAPTSTTKVVNGRTFTIASSATWVTDASGTSSCAGMGREAGYQRITSTVTWNGQGSFTPVTLDSIKAVKNGGYKDSRGSLAVKILKGTGGGQANIPVSITGPKNYSATTDSSGCVLLGFVPVGSYNVSVSKAGYVRDTLPNAQAVSEPVQVAGEQTGSVAFNYDQAGSLAVRYWTRVPGGSDVSSISGTNVTGDGFTVANTGLGFPNMRTFGSLSTPTALVGTGPTTGAVDASTTTPSKVLFPFTSGYGVWAGDCAGNDPSLSANGGWTAGTGATQSGNGTGVVPAGGAVGNVQAFEPMMKTTVNKYTNSAQTTTGAVTVAAKVTVVPVVSGCTGNYSINTAANGTIADASQPTMPYGSYTICAQDKTTAPTKRVVKAVNNNVRVGQPVTMTLPFGTTNPAAC